MLQKIEAVKIALIQAAGATRSCPTVSSAPAYDFSHWMTCQPFANHVMFSTAINRMLLAATELSGMPDGLRKPKKLPFEEAVLNWIISICQPITCVEKPSFKAMLKPAGFPNPVLRADAVFRESCLRLDALGSELRILKSSASSSTLPLAGWTSRNSPSMLAVNAHGCPPLSSNIELVLSSLKSESITLERILQISSRRF